MDDKHYVVYHGALPLSDRDRAHLERVWGGTVVDKWTYYNEILPRREGRHDHATHTAGLGTRDSSDV